MLIVINFELKFDQVAMPLDLGDFDNPNTNSGRVSYRNFGFVGVRANIWAVKVADNRSRGMAT